MKKNIILLFVLNLLMVLNCYGQTSKVKTTELKNKQKINLLPSVDAVVIKSSKLLTLHAYKISNGAGSAKAFETDETNYQILIAVSNGDEVPEQHLYKLGDFYDPEIIRTEVLPDGNFRLDVVYGTHDNKVTLKYQVFLKKVVLITR